MSYKDIVVHHGRDADLKPRLDAAVRLAQRFQAHLTGVYAIGYPAVPGFMGMEAVPEVIEQQYEQLRQDAEAAERRYREAMRKQGLGAEWRLIDGDPIDAMVLCTRYADLAVVGQANPDAPTAYDDLPDQLVLAGGRPVITVPYIGAPEAIGRRVLIAWNGTREATRAVHDAMPFLMEAEAALVFSVNPPDEEHIAGSDIATHLARHGVKATAHHAVAEDMQVGDTLLSAVSDHEADLLVMGAYGHSRLRELTLGGATRHLLKSMTVPVLMSH